MTDSSPGLITILRSALARLSDESTGPPDDPALTSFKQRILRSIAQLELERTSLRAPDVIVPEPSATLKTQSTHAPPPSTPQQPLAPDSVTVLVARRPRKRNRNRNRNKDDGSSGHSSAA